MIPAFRRQKQVDLCEFPVSQSYIIERPYLKITTKLKNHSNKIKPKPKPILLPKQTNKQKETEIKVISSF